MTAVGGEWWSFSVRLSKCICLRLTHNQYLKKQKKNLEYILNWILSWKRETVSAAKKRLDWIFSAPRDVNTQRDISPASEQERKKEANPSAKSVYIRESMERFCARAAVRGYVNIHRFICAARRWSTFVHYAARTAVWCLYTHSRRRNAIPQLLPSRIEHLLSPFYFLVRAD